MPVAAWSCCAGPAGRLRRRDAPEAAAAPTTAAGVGVVTVAADGVQEITLQTQDDYIVHPDPFTVAPGKVRLTVVNVAEQMTHNFEFTTGAGPEPIDASIAVAGARARRRPSSSRSPRPVTTRSSAASTSSWGRSASMTVRG